MRQQLTQEKVEHLGRQVQLPANCPLRTPTTAARFEGILREAGGLSMDMQEHLSAEPDTATWLRSAVEASRPLLRPWAMELMFLIGASQKARFGELESGLGISSKVLTTRLKELVAAGQVERIVVDATPVQVHYRLTKTGRATAALATPLFTHLNLVA